MILLLNLPGAGLGFSQAEGSLTRLGLSAELELAPHFDADGRWCHEEGDSESGTVLPHETELHSTLEGRGGEGKPPGRKALPRTPARLHRSSRVQM